MLSIHSLELANTSFLSMDNMILYPHFCLLFVSRIMLMIVAWRNYYYITCAV